MTTVLKFTEEYRQELLRLNAERFYFFTRSTLGMRDLNDTFHVELCDNLQGIGNWGDWRRGIVTAARGFLKSSISTISFPTWAGLHPEALKLKDHSTRILAASFENGQRNFIQPIHDLFRKSRQSDYLLWLYSHRIPEGFVGWTESVVMFNKYDPLSQPAISLKGMGADQEGYHGNLIITDDPEGADAAKSVTPNEDARRAVNNATPLLINPSRDRILVVATPHGDDPLVWRLLHQSLGEAPPKRGDAIEEDNSKRIWKKFFVPLLDKEDRPTWPERFPAETVKMIRSTVDRRTWDQQYMLREQSGGGGIFKMEDVERGYFEWWFQDKRLVGVKYKARLADKEKWQKEKIWDEKVVERKARFDEMRYYLHSDLIHREDTVTNASSGGKRPSLAAFVVVGVTNDFHAFTLSTWTGRCSIEEQARLAFRFHQQYGLYRATWDSIGAQIWFKSFLEATERSNPAFQKLRSSGKYGESRLLPRLSAILEEDKRSVRMHKEDVIFERLAPWIESGTLHFHPDQEEMLKQIRTAFDMADFVDLIDALAQGPNLWNPPAPKTAADLKKRNDAIIRSRRAQGTGYWSPYRDKLPKPKTDLAPPDGWGVN